MNNRRLLSTDWAKTRNCSQSVPAIRLNDANVLVNYDVMFLSTDIT